MNVLEKERALLEIQMSDSLTLFPNSIFIETYPNLEDSNEEVILSKTTRVGIDIRYASMILNIMVKLEKPIDFVVSTYKLLPMKYLDGRPFPADYPNMSLVELIKWIIIQTKYFMLECLSSYKNLTTLHENIQSLLEMNIVEKDCYEILVFEEKATLFLKFKVANVYVSDLQKLVREDKLLNDGGNFFVLKLVFDANTGDFISDDFKVAYSSNILSILQGIENVEYQEMRPFEDSSFIDFILNVKEDITKAIVEFQDAWEARANLLLDLYQFVDENNMAIPFIDHNTMSSIDLAFQTNKEHCVFRIKITSNNSPPSESNIEMTVFSKAKEVRETRSGGTVRESEASWDLVTTNKREENLALKILRVFSETVSLL